MTGGIRSTVDEELKALAPPSPLDGPALAAADRRSLRRRRRTGGVLAAVVVLTAITVAAANLLGGNGSAAPDPAASDGQPSFQLPPIDPAKEYTWRYYVLGETEQTRVLAQGLWAGLTAVDGLSVLARSPGSEVWTIVEDADDAPPVERAEAELVEPTADSTTPETGHTQPIYRISGGPAPELTRDGVEGSAHLDLFVFPEGDYLRDEPPTAASHW